MISKLKTYLNKRSWKKKQLEYLRTIILEDVNWFASVPGAKEITERYELLTRDDWYKYETKTQNTLRYEIKLKQEQVDHTNLSIKIELLKKDKEQLQQKIASLYGNLRKCQKSHDTHNRY